MDPTFSALLTVAGQSLPATIIMALFMLFQTRQKLRASSDTHQLDHELKSESQLFSQMSAQIESLTKESAENRRVISVLQDQVGALQKDLAAASVYEKLYHEQVALREKGKARAAVAISRQERENKKLRNNIGKLKQAQSLGLEELSSITQEIVEEADSSPSLMSCSLDAFLEADSEGGYE